MSALSDVISALTSAGLTSTEATSLLGSHLTQQSNMQTSIKALMALANPSNASSIATQIGALPGVPATVTPLLTELAQAKDQATITTIGLQIESALNSGSVLSALGL